MKKIISVLLIICMLSAACVTLGSCGGDEDKDGLSIVTTIFPAYDWACEVMGELSENAEMTLLLDNGIDMHNYQPTAKDIITISSCDLFIYVGGESDTWAESVLATAANTDMKVINIMELLGEEGLLENEAHDEHEEHDEHEDHEGHEHETDEHVWLSLKNAKTVCEEIARQLSAIDPENGAAYQANLGEYTAKIDALDAEYAAAVASADKNAILFADRFPFRYMANDYGLDYYAAFSGCSSESEASFETLVHLADMIDELGLTAVLTIDGSDTKLAQTVIANTALKNQQILSMNSMQSVTLDDIDNGADYLAFMRENLEVLTEALR